MVQAGLYSAVTHYLKAIKAAGTDAADPVIAKMKATPVNDFFAQRRRHRPGRPAPPRHVPGPGEDPGGVEVPLGLLQDRQDDPGRRGLPLGGGPDVPARREEVS